MAPIFSIAFLGHDWPFKCYLLLMSRWMSDQALQAAWIMRAETELIVLLFNNGAIIPTPLKITAIMLSIVIPEQRSTGITPPTGIPTTGPNTGITPPTGIPTTGPNIGTPPGTAFTPAGSTDTNPPNHADALFTSVNSIFFTLIFALWILT
ncbi:hypothetical protein F3Y22_tig00111277pilonHSYRG00010 [Hibiscus syriacus]|uniref:Uncharacterized protein n=1 Tax=Hibiscus syriacus TaxID=106335 RepID=A0A6A2YRC8_HIBSY|nr:hypothetical protein F3Y22_tig00111277pilonHSYRG00010 [Hibiscus syriacus]